MTNEKARCCETCKYCFPHPDGFGGVECRFNAPVGIVKQPYDQLQPVVGRFPSVGHYDICGKYEQDEEAITANQREKKHNDKIFRKRKHFDHDIHKFSNLMFYDLEDAPDYPDAMVTSGEYEGEELTYDEIDDLNQDRDLVHLLLIEHHI